MESYINDITEVSDITYQSELTRHEAWRVKFALIRQRTMADGLI